MLTFIYIYIIENNKNYLPLSRRPIAPGLCERLKMQPDSEAQETRDRIDPPVEDHRLIIHRPITNTIIDTRLMPY